MHRDLKWDDLRFILAIARGGTYLAASLALDVSHTTVSRRLASFEERHAVRVFDQRQDGLVLTEIGERIVSHAERIAADIDDLGRHVFGEDLRLVGTIGIATVDTIASFLAPTFLEFQKKFPEITLDVSVEGRLTNEADIWFRATNNPPEHLVGRKLMTMRYAPFASRDLVDVYGTDFNALPWITWNERVGAKLTEAWMRTNAPDAKISAFVNSPYVMLSFLEQSVGATFAPVGFVAHMDNLVQLGPVEPTFDFPMWMLTHPKVKTSAKVRELWDFTARDVKRRANVLPTEP